MGGLQKEREIDALLKQLVVAELTKQDADLTNYQTVSDVSRRQFWPKIPVPDYSADWTHFNLEELWG